MSFQCSISGEICEDPVCTPNGDIYERRVILKYIASNGTDPVTKDPLTEQNLISLKKPVLTETISKPQSSSEHSLPSLLSAFQNEWDAIVLETYNLKTQLKINQQELHNALYQFDAACRVIARLTKERDQYKEEVERLKAKLGNIKSTQEMDIEEESKYPGLSDEIKAKIDETLEELKTKRRDRQISPTLASVSDIKRYTLLGSYPIHKANMPGILSVDIHSDDNLILTGGVDRTAVIFDRSTGKKVSTLSGHTKPVIDARFHPTSDVIITASEDETVKLWKPAKSNKYSPFETLKVHDAAITSLDLHPIGELAYTSSKDGTWAVYDIERGQVLLKQSDSSINSGINIIRIHPDGAIMATGGEDNAIHIWDVKSGKLIMTLNRELHQDQILDLSFSENGAYLASSGMDNKIGIWDLRGATKIANTLQLDNRPTKIQYDYSGKYFASSCGQEIRVFTGRKLEFVQTFDDHSDIVTGIKWGVDAKWFASTSMDRTLKIWGSEPVVEED